MTTSARRTLRGLNPVYVMLGATDLAAQKLREIGANSVGESAQDATDARAQLRQFARGARQIPVLALNETVDVVVRTQSQYADLAERGVRIIKRRPQVQQGEGLLHRAQETATRGQSAASRAAHNAADQTRGRANSALHSARHQADEVVEAVNHVAQLGRSNAPALLRRGSVARPVRGAGAAVAGKAGEPVADTERPKPRRPRLSTTAVRAKAAEEEGRRSAVAAGAGIEAGATVTTKKSPTKTAKTAANEGAPKAKSTPKRPAAKKSTSSRTGTAAAGKSPAEKAAPRRRSASATPKAAAAEGVQETKATEAKPAPTPTATTPESTTASPVQTTNAPSGTDD